MGRDEEVEDAGEDAHGLHAVGMAVRKPIQNGLMQKYCA